jgi:hypothetical protein
MIDSLDGQKIALFGHRSSFKLGFLDLDHQTPLKKKAQVAAPE